MKKMISIDEPPITSYPAIANVLSVLWKHKESVMPWISDHFIQLIMRPDYPHTTADYYDHADLDNYYCILFGCPYLDWMRNNCYTASYNLLSDYIERQIDQGYCLVPSLDRYYFEFSDCYKNEHFIHPTFIYGYDKKKREIYVSDFYNLERYSRKIVDYDSINSSMSNDYIINLYKYQSSDYKLNISLMNTYLEDYLYSRDSMKKYAFSSQEYNHNVIFGLDFYNYMKDEMCKNIIDYRPFHILCDHKKLMNIRLEYLKSIGTINEERINELIIMNSKLNMKSIILRNMVLKYNMNGDKDLLKNIKNMCILLREEDRLLVEKILSITCG